MKLLTANFVQCSVKACSATPKCFPLHFDQQTADVPLELAHEDVDFSPEFIYNILPRIDWPALLITARELGNNMLPETTPEIENPNAPENEQILRDLHTLLLETQIIQGSMRCENCNHIYFIRDSIPNFLLPGHLVQ
ncbi:subunit of an adoMet-dependent tRNA methyltransferase complex (Trm11p-Trm112p) [Myxozyma melibiosi]|uniref:Subunit of an adoMet-dependent tRNA methyltransferase complex (Trm11p-Trm112p) n=1 Tax=Myxozyma melibiosi TaxID=54550 RepID=A0ABR1F4A5_9ASCO